MFFVGFVMLVSIKHPADGLVFSQVTAGRVNFFLMNFKN